MWELRRYICLMSIAIFLLIYWRSLHINIRKLTTSIEKASVNNKTYLAQFDQIMNNIICPAKATAAPKCPPSPLINPKQNCTIEEFVFEDFKCYQRKNVTPIDLLEDVMDSPRKPRLGKTIFFVETQCTDNSIIKLSPRLFFLCSFS